MQYGKDHVFDNCAIYAPDNVLLSRASEKRIRWYLRHGLAELISPGNIRLKFEPSGREGVDDPFLLSAKPNHCVVCGIKERLTRHHVIPQCIIMHFPERFKKHNSHDVLAMCTTCHRSYEDRSDCKRQELADLLNISVHGKNHELLVLRRNLQGMAITLCRHGDKLPSDRAEFLLGKIEAEFGPMSPEELEVFSKRSDEELRAEVDYQEFGDAILSLVKDYNTFAAEWREHFVETMNPQYMPDHWKTDRIKAV